MKKYMLDTNTVSYLIKGHKQVAKRVVDLPMASLCISAITEGELYFGVAKRPEAKHLYTIVTSFLRHVDVLPWDGSVTEKYGCLRADMEKKGHALSPLDLLIAAHAVVAEVTLVTNDRAFSRVVGLQLENWTV